MGRPKGYDKVMPPFGLLAAVLPLRPHTKGSECINHATECLRRIGDTLAEVFVMAESEAISTEAAAERLVRRRRLAAALLTPSANPRSIQP